MHLQLRGFGNLLDRVSVVEVVSGPSPFLLLFLARVAYLPRCRSFFSSCRRQLDAESSIEIYPPIPTFPYTASYTLSRAVSFSAWRTPLERVGKDSAIQADVNRSGSARGLESGTSFGECCSLNVIT